MIHLDAASLENTGLIREANEDTVWAQVYSPNAEHIVGLFIVCDGMGGHMGGQYASYWAVETIKREFSDLFVSKDPRATLALSKEDIAAARAGVLVYPKQNEIDFKARMLAAVHKANDVVYDYARHKPSQAANAGTTVTAAVVYDDQMVVANAGDSRAYLLRNCELRQITYDHSLVASMVSNGQILPFEIYTHPQRNVIYQYLGQKGQAQPDVFHHQLRPGDQILLCTDGLWEMVRGEKRLAQILEEANTSQDACQQLVDAANAAGGEDNIGVIVVKVGK